MDNNVIQDLIKAIESLNNPWVDMASLIAVSISLVALWISTREFFDKQKPQLDVAFAAPWHLACISLKNTGSVPLEVKQLRVDDEFIASLPRGNANKFKGGGEIKNIILLPNERQYILLGEIDAADLIQDRVVKELKVYYTFCRANSKRLIQKEKTLDFQGYANLMTESDISWELRNTNAILDKIAKCNVGISTNTKQQE